MAQAVSPPGPDSTIHAGGELGNELAALRSHLRLVDELDEQATELVARLADAVRSSAEVRAQVGVEIAASLERVERLLSERQSRQREVIASLRQDVIDAYARALGLATVVQSFESEIAGLQTRLSTAAAEHDEESGVGQAAGSADPGASSPSAVAPGLVSPPLPQPAAASVLIEVQQVPSASVALSIQRFIAGLPGVVAATTREYAAGLLRLEVMVRGAVRVDEIGLWPGGRLELIEQATDGICLRVVA